MENKDKYVMFTYSTSDYYVKYGENGQAERVNQNALSDSEIDLAFRMTGHWHKVYEIKDHPSKVKYHMEYSYTNPPAMIIE